MSSQTITAAVGSSTQSTVINSTKVKVTANANSVLYTVGSNPTAGSGFANTEMIAGGTTRYINMQGLGNKIAFTAPNQASLVTVTEIGSVSTSGLATNATYITT